MCASKEMGIFGSVVALSRDFVYVYGVLVNHGLLLTATLGLVAGIHDLP